MKIQIRSPPFCEDTLDYIGDVVINSRVTKLKW